MSDSDAPRVVTALLLGTIWNEWLERQRRGNRVTLLLRGRYYHTLGGGSAVRLYMPGGKSPTPDPYRSALHITGDLLEVRNDPHHCRS